MRAMVTGATGFIGRRLIEYLLGEGVEVVALVRGEAQGLPPSVVCSCGDVTDGASLGDAGRGCDRLYHLAARISFDPAQRAELLRVNGQGTATVLAAARRWGIERCVVVSSACTLGLSGSAADVLDEGSAADAPAAARNPYLASKLAAEDAAREASGEQWVAVVNPTTVYGAGDWSLNSGTLVAKVARSRVVPVPSGGSNVVDVGDVASGVVAAGERGQSGCRYVLGGANLPFAEIIATIAAAVGRRPVCVPLPRWMRGPMAAAAWAAGKLGGGRFMTPQIVGDLFAFKYYSSALAERELGWTARVPFRESIAQAWAFYEREGLV